LKIRLDSLIKFGDKTFHVVTESGLNKSSVAVSKQHNIMNTISLVDNLKVK